MNGISFYSVRIFASKENMRSEEISKQTNELITTVKFSTKIASNFRVRIKFQQKSIQSEINVHARRTVQGPPRV